MATAPDKSTLDPEIYDTSLDPHVLTDKQVTKTLPCVECKRACVVTTFMAPAKVKCNECKGGGNGRTAGSQAVVQAGRTDPSLATNLSDCLINPSFGHAVCPHDEYAREKAWLAGLLEGEGSFHFRTTEDQKYPVPTIALSMCDEDVVHKAAVLMGGYTVTKCKQPNPDHSDFFQVRVSGWPAIDIMQIIRPWMGKRRGEKIDEMLRSEYVENVQRGARHANDIADTLGSHSMELKDVVHAPNYGPRHLEGYKDGVPQYRTETGEAVSFQCKQCRVVVSYSNQHQGVMRRINEPRQSPRRTEKSSMETLLGVRDE